jgi:hypothetical protein
MLAQVEWSLGAPGARATAAACVRDGLAAILRTPDWLSGLALLAEPVAAYGTPDEVGQLAAALSEHAELNVVMDDACAAFGPVARPLGLLLAAAGRPEEAARHFERAVELARRWDAPGWQLAAIADWLGSGVPAARSDALRDRGLSLARELELPWIAAVLAQTTTP